MVPVAFFPGPDLRLPGSYQALRPSWCRAERILCDADVGPDLAFREILPLLLVCSASAPRSNQSPSPSSVSSILCMFWPVAQKLLEGLDILTLKMEIKKLKFPIGTLVPRMPSEEHTESGVRKEAI